MAPVLLVLVRVGRGRGMEELFGNEVELDTVGEEVELDAGLVTAVELDGLQEPFDSSGGEVAGR